MAKLKVCSSCSKETVMWKAKTKTNGALCKRCYLQSGVNGKERKDKPVQKPIKPISNKKALELKEYRKLRDEYLSINVFCEARVKDICTHGPVELHHLKPRAYHLCDTNVFMAVCRSCHNWIERNDKDARALGLKLYHL